MNPDKKVIVEQLVSRVKDSPYMIVVDYTGMTVPQFNDVRKKLRGIGASFHVTKNSYVKALGKEKGYPADVEKHLAGQTAIVFGEGELAPAGKIMKTFTKESKKGEIKAGVLEGAYLGADEVNAIADLGSLSNVRSMLLGVIQGVPAAVARVINLGKAGGGEPKEEEAAPAAEAAA
jgi:large subunit ribosomal protein L10